MPNPFSAPSRRSLLAGAAVLPLVQPAIASPPPIYPDAGLLTLGERWSSARMAYLEASAASDALGDATPLPEPPETVFFRATDLDFCFNECTDRHANGRRWYFVGAPGDRAARAARLRRPIMRAGAKIWAEAQARADEIVTAYDGWRAALETAKEASGISASERTVGQLGRALLAIERAIEATSAMTLAGLRIKAQLAQCDLDEGEEPPLDLVRGIIADLMAMGDVA